MLAETDDEEYFAPTRKNSNHSGSNAANLISTSVPSVENTGECLPYNASRPPSGFCNWNMVVSYSSCSEDECTSTNDTCLSVSSEPIVYTFSNNNIEKSMWNSEPSSLNPPIHHHRGQKNIASDQILKEKAVVTINSHLSNTQFHNNPTEISLEILEILSRQESGEIGETLLNLSEDPKKCRMMRHSGCIQFLVQLLQSNEDIVFRSKVLQALYNLIKAQSDGRAIKKELRILKLLEQVRIYTQSILNNFNNGQAPSGDNANDNKHPVQTVVHLMKLSFDSGHAQLISQFGGIHTFANLIETEHVCHDSTANDSLQCILLHRYACMILTNITFGDSSNKALLCSYRKFMRALVVQLKNRNDDVKQVSASVLGNLSWHADSASRDVLREVGAVAGLTKAAMHASKEQTLKSILNALWNLSAHSTENKAEICAIDGSLSFLVDALSHQTPAIVENSGGILRNVSSQIAVRDDYREILRKQDCLRVLLQQLKSTNVTVVNNACGTLCNLSLKCHADQEALLKMGAVEALRDLTTSKHKMISLNSKAALQNLSSAARRQKESPALTFFIRQKQKQIAGDAEENVSKISDQEEINTTEQPIDYSRKYAEIKPPTEYVVSKNEITKNEKDFGVYAETDLDQPTDYSLQYAEDDSDSDICDKMSKNEGGEFLQDTVKTYCTEGTPYQTPFNFSTATSMSDLRGEELVKQKQMDELKEFQESKSAVKVPKSEFSSGLISPEKPVNYCEEGTPGYFSRVSSFGSLNSTPPSEAVKCERGAVASGMDGDDASGSPEIKLNKAATEVAVKMVKFEQVLNYAEETPLMFSRSSSLASLDSIEQHSIHDDRSSVVSDFSRLTSGIVSPSELPDSPTQTVPPSPKSRKSVVAFPPGPSKTPFSQSTNEKDAPPPAVTRTIQKADVFQDDVMKFKEENTPVQFSRATSLSSLTIDDHDESTGQKDGQVGKLQVIASGDRAEANDVDAVDGSLGEAELNDDVLILSDDEGDEDILATCIKMGMQSSKYRTDEQQSPMNMFANPFKYQAKTENLHHSSSSLTNTTLLQETNSNASCVRYGRDATLKYDDDRNCSLSGEDYKIIAECIQAGMKKTEESSREVKKLQHRSQQNLRNCCRHCSRGNSSYDFHKTGSLDSCFDKSTDGHPLEDCELSVQDYKALSECIRIGMSKARFYNNSSPVKSPSVNREEESFITRSAKSTPNKTSKEGVAFLGTFAKDELASYAVENSPYQFSLRSSLSDLTVDGSIAGTKSLLTKSIASANEIKTATVTDSPSIAEVLVPSLENEREKNDSEESKGELHNVSEDEDQDDDILAACIRMGMQKNSYCTNETIAKLSSPKIDRTNAHPVGETEAKSKQPLVGYLQNHSSFNKLTFRIKPKHGGVTKSKRGRRNFANGETCDSVKASYNSYNHRVAGDSGPSSLPANYRMESCKHQCGLSRQDSLSSLSLESFGLDENEQALLEQCILSGMTKGRSGNTSEGKAIRKSEVNNVAVVKGKQDKRKSKRALVESVGRVVVDLLKLRKT